MANNANTNNKNYILTEYFAAITFLLAVGYFLFITNPPSNLQTVVDNILVYKKLLTFADIQTNGDSIAIFLLFFGVLSFFIGLLLASVYDRITNTWAHLLPSFIIVVMLAWIVYPYYGQLVALETIPFGFFGWYLGLFYSSKFRGEVRKYWFSYIPAILMSGFLAIIFMGFLIKAFTPLDYFLIFIVGLVVSILLTVSLIYATFILESIKLIKKKRSKKQPCSDKSDSTTYPCPNSGESPPSQPGSC